MTTDKAAALARFDERWHVDQQRQRLVAVARYLNLDPDDIKAQAVVLVCDRYGLDAYLNHVEIVEHKIYISRDGWLHIAHESGVFDGMKTEEERESENGYSATVTVYRK